MSLSRRLVLSCALAALSLGVAPSSGGVIVVDYTFDAGGRFLGPLNGLSGQVRIMNTGDKPTITLINTSTGTPDGFTVADSLLVSFGFALPSGVTIEGTAGAIIAPGSFGLGAWADRGPGSHVSEEWLYTNDFGGDAMAEGARLAARQVISTSEGQGGGATFRFDGGDETVDGPWGGMTANPPLFGIPETQPAVQSSITFIIDLTSAISDEEWLSAAFNGVLEFGSDAKYVVTVPATSAAPVLLAGLAVLGRRRR